MPDFCVVYSTTTTSLPTQEARAAPVTPSRPVRLYAAYRSVDDRRRDTTGVGYASVGRGARICQQPGQPVGCDERDAHGSRIARASPEVRIYSRLWAPCCTCCVRVARREVICWSNTCSPFTRYPSASYSAVSLRHAWCRNTTNAHKRVSTHTPNSRHTASPYCRGAYPTV